MFPVTRRPLSLALALLALALVGSGVGASLVALSGAETTTTVVERTVPGVAATVRGGATTVADVYRLAGPSVVEIAVTAAGGAQQAVGSGFVYDARGDIVTNDHVVQDAGTIRVRFADGTRARARPVGHDASTDLAVVRVDVARAKLHPLRLADSSRVRVGDDVVAIGSPFGLQGTVTSGIVSALHRQMTAPNNFAIDDAIQTDAAINHGNSGGPLLDMRARVIGVDSQIESNSGGNDGVGFAVPSNTVKSVVSQLVRGVAVRHAYLGITATTIPAAAALRLGLAAGVEAASVRAGTPAARAGLRGSTGLKRVDGVPYPTGGDVITRIDGKRVASAAELRRTIDAHEPGDRLRLTVVRNGRTRVVELRLANRPN